eukprot:g3624.t1
MLLTLCESFECAPGCLGADSLQPAEASNVRVVLKYVLEVLQTNRTDEKDIVVASLRFIASLSHSEGVEKSDFVRQIVSPPPIRAAMKLLASENALIIPALSTLDIMLGRCLIMDAKYEDAAASAGSDCLLTLLSLHEGSALYCSMSQSLLLPPGRRLPLPNRVASIAARALRNYATAPIPSPESVLSHHTWRKPWLCALGCLAYVASARSSSASSNKEMKWMHTLVDMFEVSLKVAFAVSGSSASSSRIETDRNDHLGVLATDLTLVMLSTIRSAAQRGDEEVERDICNHICVRTSLYGSIQEAARRPILLFERVGLRAACASMTVALSRIAKRNGKRGDTMMHSTSLPLLQRLESNEEAPKTGDDDAEHPTVQSKSERNDLVRNLFDDSEDVMMIESLLRVARKKRGRRKVAARATPGQGPINSSLAIRIYDQ